MNPQYVSETENNYIYYMCKIPVISKDLKFNTLSIRERQNDILLNRSVVLYLLGATTLLIVPLFSFSLKNQIISSCSTNQAQPVLVNDNYSSKRATVVGYRKGQQVLVNKLKSFIGNVQRLPSTAELYEMVHSAIIETLAIEFFKVEAQVVDAVVKKLLSFSINLLEQSFVHPLAGTITHKVNLTYNGSYQPPLRVDGSVNIVKATRVNPARNTGFISSNLNEGTPLSASSSQRDISVDARFAIDDQNFNEDEWVNKSLFHMTRPGIYAKAYVHEHISTQIRYAGCSGLSNQNQGFIGQRLANGLFNQVNHEVEHNQRLVELANLGTGLISLDFWPVELLPLDASPELVRDRERYWLVELQSRVPPGHDVVHVHIQHGTVDNEAWSRLVDQARYNYEHGITFPRNYDGLPRFQRRPYI